jgi:hypothetical protein
MSGWVIAAVAVLVGSLAVFTYVVLRVLTLSRRGDSQPGGALTRL